MLLRRVDVVPLLLVLSVAGCASGPRPPVVSSPSPGAVRPAEPARLQALPSPLPSASPGAIPRQKRPAETGEGTDASEPPAVVKETPAPGPESTPAPVSMASSSPEPTPGPDALTLLATPTASPTATPAATPTASPTTPAATPTASPTTPAATPTASPTESAGTSVTASSTPTRVALASGARQGLYYDGDGIQLSFPRVYEEMERLLPGTCPGAVRIVRVPWSDARTESAAWADADAKTIYFMTEDTSFLEGRGLQPTLLGLLARVCLGQVTRQGAVILSRQEKAFRFLEEGFTQYLGTRPEAAALGGRPEAWRAFLDFAAHMELLDAFTFDDFWKRLPDAREVADASQPFHPRRMEAQLVAGAFVRDLIEDQGLGVEGYRQLWQLIADIPFVYDAKGRAMPQAAVVPVLSGLLSTASNGRIAGVDAAWKAFTKRLNAQAYDRPRVSIQVLPTEVQVNFSRPMLSDRVDLTVNGMQIGPERLETGLGHWEGEQSLHLTLNSLQAQLGLSALETLEVNYGRIWQWFRGRDGVPAEGARWERESATP